MRGERRLGICDDATLQKTDKGRCHRAIGLLGYQAVGLSGCRAIGRLGLPGCRAIGLSGYSSASPVHLRAALDAAAAHLLRNFGPIACGNPSEGREWGTERLTILVDACGLCAPCVRFTTPVNRHAFLMASTAMAGRGTAAGAMMCPREMNPLLPTPYFLLPTSHLLPQGRMSAGP